MTKRKMNPVKIINEARQKVTDSDHYSIINALDSIKDYLLNRQKQRHYTVLTVWDTLAAAEKDVVRSTSKLYPTCPAGGDQDELDPGVIAHFKEMALIDPEHYLDSAPAEKVIDYSDNYLPPSEEVMTEEEKETAKKPYGWFLPDFAAAENTMNWMNELGEPGFSPTAKYENACIEVSTVELQAAGEEQEDPDKIIFKMIQGLTFAEAFTISEMLVCDPSRLEAFMHKNLQLHPGFKGDHNKVYPSPAEIMEAFDKSNQIEKDRIAALDALQDESKRIADLCYDCKQKPGSWRDHLGVQLCDDCMCQRYLDERTMRRF